MPDPVAGSSPISEVNPGRRIGCFVALLLLVIGVLAAVGPLDSYVRAAEAGLDGVLSALQGQPAGRTLGTFESSAGTTVDVRLLDSFANRQLWLRSPSGVVLPNEHGERDQLSCMLLPEDGTYTVLWDGPEGNPARFEVRAALAPVQQLETEAMLAAILKDCHAVYSLQGRAGQTITVRADGQDFDAMLRLQDSGGRELAFNDDDEGTDPALTSVGLPADGVYWLTVLPFTPGAGGVYTLLVTSF